MAAAAMEEEEAGNGEGGENPHIRASHIKKRALKNKALSVSFSEKDLKYKFTYIRAYIYIYILHSPRIV